MTLFLRKIVLLSLLFIGFNSLVLWAIPKDNNSYMCEYMRKINLLDSVKQPRIIFIGGSNVAFGIDSKRIKDSLGCNVINFGLHAGIGIKYPVEDYLNYARKGDVVVLQFEYSNFYGGENGTPTVFSKLMVSTGWRNLSSLKLSQVLNLRGLVPECMGRIISLIKYPITGSFNTLRNKRKFQYSLAGFNDYGDEISHCSHPNIKLSTNQFVNKGILNNDFLIWLSETISRIEKKGIQVLVLPPVCAISYYRSVYNDEIEKALFVMGHPYRVSPSIMSLKDECMFDTGYHMNKMGVDKNTTKIIKILKTNISQPSLMVYRTSP